MLKSTILKGFDPHQTIQKATSDEVSAQKTRQLIQVFVFICWETGSPSTTLLRKNNDDRFWLLTFNVLRGDVSFSFLCCFLKIAPNSTLLLMPKSMFMLNSYHSLERNKLLKCFHFNFYTFPLIPFFCSVAHNFNVFLHSVNMYPNLQTKSEQKHWLKRFAGFILTCCTTNLKCELRFLKNKYSGKKSKSHESALLPVGFLTLQSLSLFHAL